MDSTTVPTWVFSKGRERLQVRRTDRTTLDIERANAAETLHLDSAAVLVEFQVGLERRLLASGWRFAAFRPVALSSTSAAANRR